MSARKACEDVPYNHFAGQRGLEEKKGKEKQSHKEKALTKQIGGVLHASNAARK